MKIILPGEPTSQKRPRIFAKGAMDPCWQAKEQHRDYIRDHYPDVWAQGDSLCVYLSFSYTFPKSMSKKKRLEAKKITKPDLDNLVKYVLDMGNDVLWMDDSIITYIVASKFYSDKSETIIEIIS